MRASCACRMRTSVQPFHRVSRSYVKIDRKCCRHRRGRSGAFDVIVEKAKQPFRVRHMLNLEQVGP